MLCDLIDRRFADDAALANRFPDCPAAGGGRCRELMTFIQDRPGPDRRYAICADKLFQELYFRVQRPLAEGIAQVGWYVDNEPWWRPIQSGAYRDWIKLQYGVSG